MAGSLALAVQVESTAEEVADVHTYAWQNEEKEQCLWKKRKSKEKKKTVSRIAMEIICMQVDSVSIITAVQ